MAPLRAWQHNQQPVSYHHHPHHVACQHKQYVVTQHGMLHVSADGMCWPPNTLKLSAPSQHCCSAPDPLGAWRAQPL